MFKITKDRLFPEMPDTIAPVIFVFIWTFGMLYFEFTGQAAENPMIIFTLPLLLLLWQVRTVDDIKQALGIRLDNIRHWIGVVIGIPIAAYLGYYLALLGKTKGSIIALSLYPFNAASTQVVSSGSWAFQMANLTGFTAILVFLPIAFGEEAMKLLSMKYIANWMYPRIKSVLFIIPLAWLISWALWSCQHFFAYGGFGTPELYISLMFLGFLWTILGMGIGIIAYGWKAVREKRYILLVLCFSLIASGVSHLVYDVFMTIL